MNLLFLLPYGLTAMQVLTIDLGSELGPAISLAYEKPESDIMKRKPRNAKKDKLVSVNLLFYSYMIAGIIESCTSVLAYMFIYHQHNIMLSDFPINDPSTGQPGTYFALTTTDSVTIPRTGEFFTAAQQRNIFSQAATAFYITLTVSQFCHIWVCKTRTNSLFVHGFANKSMYWGVLVGLCIVIFFSYVPGVHNFVGSAVVNWTPWAFVPATGFVLLSYGEGYKWFYRHHPDGKVIEFLAW